MAMVADTAFIKTYGGVNFEEFHDIVQLPDSGFMMTGYTNGYGNGSNAVYVVRADKNGTRIWSKAIGGVGTDLAYSISADQSGHYYIAGTTNSYGFGGYDGYLICLDSAGTVLWEKTYGGSDWDFLNCVKVMSDESILLAGETYSFSDGGSDAWVLHLNNTGDTTWTKHFGSSGNDAFKGIELSSTAIYLAGYIDSTDAEGKNGLLVKLDLAGNVLFELHKDNLGRDELNNSMIMPNGNLLIYGRTEEFDSTQYDFWFESLDTNGTSNWIQNSLQVENETFNKMINTRGNTFVGVGQKDPSGNGNKSMFIGLYNEASFQVNSQSLGGANDEEGYGGIRTVEGGLALVGYTNSYGIGNRDAMLVLIRYDTTVSSPMEYNTSVFFENLSPISVTEINGESNITLSPNPAYESVAVEAKPGEIISAVSVYNYTGQLIQSTVKSSSNRLLIDLKDIQSGGLYLIKVQIANKEYVGRIMVIR